MAKYILFGQEYEIPDSYIRNFALNNRANKEAQKAVSEFNTWYKNCSGIDAVIKGFDDCTTDLVYEYALDPLYDTLAKLEIYDLSKSQYSDKCVSYRILDNSLDDILDKIEEISDNKNEMREYRSSRKANRSRFVGGGFGISGAIQGSMQAGVLNATTGLAHGVVNSIGNVGSTVVASAKKASLYNSSTKKDIGDALYSTILSIYEKHKSLVNTHYNNYYQAGFNTEKATALFENAKKYAQSFFLWDLMFLI